MQQSSDELLHDERTFSNNMTAQKQNMSGAKLLSQKRYTIHDFSNQRKTFEVVNFIEARLLESINQQPTIN